MLLRLYLAQELFLGGQVGEIFGLEQLVAAVEHTVEGHVFAGLGAEDDTYGGVVALGALQLVVHAHVHIHLPHVLVRDLVRLQINQEEALEQVVVEHQVDVIVIDVGVHVLLATYVGKALAQLHDEALHVKCQPVFERALGVAVFAAEAQELHHHGVFDVLQVVLQRCGEGVHLVNDGLLDLRLQQAEVVLGADVAVNSFFNFGLTASKMFGKSR